MMSEEDVALEMERQMLLRRIERVCGMPPFWLSRGATVVSSTEERARSLFEAVKESFMGTAKALSQCPHEWRGEIRESAEGWLLYPRCGLCRVEGSPDDVDLSTVLMSVIQIDARAVRSAPPLRAWDDAPGLMSAKEGS